MACTSDITTGRTRVCKDSLGGAKKIYFFNYVEDPFTVVANEATAINPLLTEVFEFEIEGDGNTLLQNFIGERQNGTSVNTQTLTTIFKKQDSDSSANLSFLVKGFPQSVVQDRNGNYHALGIDDGMDVSIDASTGGAKTDLNGYTVTATATTGSLAPILDSATVTAFLALLPA
jgi:hypothetical protein